MRANAYSINSRIDRIQCGMELGVYSIEVGRCHQPFADALLVCDHRDLPASIVEHPNSLNNPGEDYQLTRCLYVFSWEVLVDDTIPVEKRDANRGLHQLADGR